MESTRLSDQQIRNIKNVDYFNDTFYADLDFGLTSDFFAKRYVTELASYFDITKMTVVDCSAGFGWFGAAYLLAGGAGVISADIDESRLQAAEKIMGILGIADKTRFIASPIEKLPLHEREADIFVSIETLEHIGKNNISPAINKMVTVAAKGILLSTPNRIFPLIAHDTQLPFIHWLPPAYRRGYAALFNRKDMDHGNDFVSPMQLRQLRKNFRPVTTCYVYPEYQAFLKSYPRIPVL